jgi:O-methyltransferase
MKRTFKAILSAATRHPLGRWCLDHTVVKAARHLEWHRPSAANVPALGPIFDRFSDYTRLPKAAYCLNLSLIAAHRNIPGSIVECGVWRGGMSAGMAELLGNEREYYLFDSFEGLPPATAIDGEQALAWQAANRVDNCRADDAFAHEAMRLAGATRFHLLKGWFNQTLPDFRPAERIAILRLDADWYSSTAECLNYLYGQVVPGGLIILDDYYAWDGCARAVHDFLSLNQLRDRIQQHGETVCFLIKSEDLPIRSINPAAGPASPERATTPANPQ